MLFFNNSYDALLQINGLQKTLFKNTLYSSSSTWTDGKFTQSGSEHNVAADRAEQRNNVKVSKLVSSLKSHISICDRFNVKQCCFIALRGFCLEMFGRNSAEQTTNP